MDSLFTAYADSEEDENAVERCIRDDTSSAVGEKRLLSSVSSTEAATVAKENNAAFKREKRKQKRETQTSSGEIEEGTAHSSNVASISSLPNPFAGHSSHHCHNVASFRRMPDPTHNPQMHQGRIRSFSHVEGNWPTHIFIPFLPVNEEALVHSIEEAEIGIDKKYFNANESEDLPSTDWTRIATTNPSASPTASSVPPSNTSSSSSSSSSSSIKVAAPSLLTASTLLHFSLSRTFTLRFDQIHPFEYALRKLVQSFLSANTVTLDRLSESSSHLLRKGLGATCRDSLRVQMSQAKEYWNEECTRRFCALVYSPVAERTELSTNQDLIISHANGSDESAQSDRSKLIRLLIELTQQIDQLAQLYGAVPYHAVPELHVTVSWKLMTGESVRNDTSPAAKCMDLHCPATGIIKEIQCNIGNRVYKFPLLKRIVRQ